MLDSEVEAPTVVTVRARAANLRGATSSERVLQKAVENLPLEAIATRGEHLWTREPMILPLIRQAWQEKDYDKVQLRDLDED
ncbi:MAG TPA: hypothetical protein VGH86_04035 [Phenylobacterium sp.]|jgi:hypothetical protein